MACPAGDTPDAPTVPMIFSVSRTGPTDDPLEVRLRPGAHTTSFGITPPANDQDESGADHASPPNTITIPAGRESFEREIAVYDDGAAEGTETLELLVVEDDAYEIGGGSATLSIFDDNDVDDGGIGPIRPPNNGGGGGDDPSNDGENDAWVDVRLGWGGWHDGGGYWWRDGRPGEQWYGATDLDEPGETTGHFVRLNSDFDEYDAAGGDGTDPFYDYDNAGVHGAIPGDGEVVPLWLSLWDDGESGTEDDGGGGYPGYPGNPYGPYGGPYFSTTPTTRPSSFARRPDGDVYFASTTSSGNNEPEHGGDWELSWGGDVKLWTHALDADGLPEYAPDGRPVMEEQHSPWKGHTRDLDDDNSLGTWWHGWGVGAYVEGVSTSPGAGEMAITATYQPDAANAAEVTDATKGTVLEADLDAIRVADGAAVGLLTDQREEAVGAFVPLNDDDDDYDAGNSKDHTQNGAVAGENDLLPMVLKPVEPLDLGGHYTVKTTGTDLNVYRDPYRAEKLLAGEPLDATQETVFYVEADALGGEPEVRVDWEKEGETPQIDLDRVKVNVFDLNGPLNVPEFGTYRYNYTTQKDTEPATLPEGASWGTAAGGQEQLVEGKPASVDVRWGRGPATGRVSFKVNDDYEWGIDVNVVRVDVRAPNNGTFTPGRQSQHGTRFTVVNNPPDHRNDFFTGVSSGTLTSWSPYRPTSNGMTLRAEVILTGPAGGRGTKFVEVGFVQNLEVKTLTASYKNAAGGSRTRTSDLQGEKGFDQIDNQRGLWYDSSSDAIHDGGADGAQGSIFSGDSPAMAVPLFLSDGGVGFRLDKLNLRWNFDLFVAARSTDERYSKINEAEEGDEADDDDRRGVTYATQSLAEWRWDGTGTFNWNNVALNGVPLWSGRNKFGTTKINDWQDADGDDVIYKGTPFNDEVRTSGAHWYGGNNQ